MGLLTVIFDRVFFSEKKLGWKDQMLCPRVGQLLLRCWGAHRKSSLQQSSTTSGAKPLVSSPLEGYMSDMGISLV